MTSYIYQLELRKRGFAFNSSVNIWNGPFGLATSGYLNEDNPSTSPGMATDNGFARVAVLQQLDEQLRAKRGLSRSPLIKSVNEFTTDFTPQQPILPPQN
jgi:hypothetical protein